MFIRNVFNKAHSCSQLFSKQICIFHVVNRCEATNKMAFFFIFVKILLNHTKCTCDRNLGSYLHPVKCFLLVAGKKIKMMTFFGSFLTPIFKACNCCQTSWLGISTFRLGCQYISQSAGSEH